MIKLNIIKGPYYRNLALNNRVTKIILPAKRGEIIDRKGRKIAENIDFNGEMKRFYVYGASMSNVTGYLGKVNEDELKNGKCGQQL
ncbi:MAG TPA: hypothetical protein PLU63_01280, partial [Candidatus Woesebacteria bacterium]|nr:hypothetical protein [Candidatus Woesebacteria bacterium]